MFAVPFIVVAGPADPASAASPPASLILTYQSPAVSPGQPFTAKLATRMGGTGSDVLPGANLGIAVDVYSCLSSVSSFDQAASSASPAGSPISRTTSPLPWSSLHPSAGGVALSLGVSTAASASPIIGPGNMVVDLHSYDGSCRAGVFPVKLQLVDTSSGSSIASLTTFLVYVTGPAVQKLRFAMVVPLSAPMGPASGLSATQLQTNPMKVLARPSAAATAGIEQLTGALTTGAGSTVPVTIAANPETIQLLPSTGHPSTVSDLALLSANPAVHQFVSTPYAPVDAAALADAGLGAELATQITRGAQVLSAEGITRFPTPSPSGANGPWITNAPLDAATLARLATAGYNQLILPAADVSSPPANGSGAEPFIIDSPHGSPFTAITSNADLSSRFTADPGDPVLAASQIMAELAQIYFEYPNLRIPRAVVAVPPNAWTLDPSLITTLLGDLANSPITEAVTTQGLFQALPNPAPCRGGCRLVSAGQPSPSHGSGLPVGAIRHRRSQIADFASAISPASPYARTLPSQLGDLVLASESENLKPSQQTAILHSIGTAIRAQLDQVSIAGNQMLTLTSSHVQIPISIESKAPYPIDGTLVLSSGDLFFSNGTRRLSIPDTLTTAINNRYISVKTRTSGEFKLVITFQSTRGNLVIASGEIGIRSTATSVVGVGLSLGAIAVLAVWWVRTGFRRRSRRRAEGAGEPS
ncbi:MAG: DUF6049 family protein [Acidimicrobiales bacterium]